MSYRTSQAIWLSLTCGLRPRCGSPHLRLEAAVWLSSATARGRRGVAVLTWGWRPRWRRQQALPYLRLQAAVWLFPTLEAAVWLSLTWGWRPRWRRQQARTSCSRGVSSGSGEPGRSTGVTRPLRHQRRQAGWVPAPARVGTAHQTGELPSGYMGRLESATRVRE